MRFKNRLEAWNSGEDSKPEEESVIRKFRITDAEVLRIARNDEESGNDGGGAE